VLIDSNAAQSNQRCFWNKSKQWVSVMPAFANRTNLVFRCLIMIIPKLQRKTWSAELSNQAIASVKRQQPSLKREFLLTQIHAVTFPIQSMSSIIQKKTARLQSITSWVQRAIPRTKISLMDPASETYSLSWSNLSASIPGCKTSFVNG